MYGYSLIGHNYIKIELISNMAHELQSKIKELFDLTHSNSIDTDDLIHLVEDIDNQSPPKEIIHFFLDLAHLPSVSKSISDSGFIDFWLNKICNLIIKSNYHVGILLRQRANRYGDEIAFKIISGEKINQRTYKQIWFEIKLIGKSIISFDHSESMPIIGLLTHNQYRGALIDIACLSFGIRVIPIPTNSTPEHLNFILKQSKVSHLFIGGKGELKIWNEVYAQHDIQLIALNDSDKLKGKVWDWESFLDIGTDFDLERHINLVQMHDTASIMYTSGTTDDPKGITFSQLNIISKRFARALALPEINHKDTFLSYLPLYHTFGRFFELLGSIYWGATYVFAESPAFNSLLKDFKISRPSVFISIPKRWVQLYELIEEDINLDLENKSVIQSKIKELTGENLKWGLSAAGYLDPDIFTFFQDHGINLLSGYGMTEATGGITMTPPNEYISNSVGEALPGIKLKLTAEGELCLKGPYVTSGYFGLEHPSISQDGWFHTGDIFEIRGGHYFIIDRKKDIYKNSRGQTIAPQKIENLFQDFDLVKSVFLVGDGKEFNTVLIWPNHDNSLVDFNTASKKRVRDIYSAMILSVNNFLSPFERIVNFAIIDRDFLEKKGELTTKNTFNRKNVLKNFSKIIEPMYRRNYVAIHKGPKEIRVPNWLLREIGVLRTDIKWDNQYISLRGHSKQLILKWDKSSILLGDFYYASELNILDLGSVIQSPNLWLGNNAFTSFVGEIIFRLKEIETYSGIKVCESSINWNLITPKFTVDSGKENLLKNIHTSLSKYLGNDKSFNEILIEAVDGNRDNWTSIILDTFLMYQEHPKQQFRLSLTEALTPLLSGEFFVEMMKKNYDNHRINSPGKAFSFNINRTNDEHYRGLINYLKNAHANISSLEKNDLDFIQMLLLMVSDFGVKHPSRYIWARSELTWWQMSDVPNSICSTAQKAYYALIKGFRTWIGPSPVLTIDRDSGDEYSWEDVITFDENVRKIHKVKTLKAIKETSLIRESIFLFSSNSLIQLSDIPKNGIWISHLGSRHKKHVFRVLVRTQSQGVFNIVLNFNDGLPREFLEEEVKWLIIMGSGYKDVPLVETFGGYWPEHNLYTEQYIPVETLTTYLDRNRKDIRDEIKIDRWQMRWLHFIWNGIQAYQEFWFRTGFKYVIQPPIPENLAIPQHDYVTGTRLISISGRKPINTLGQYFLDLFTEYIINTEKRYPGLKHMSDWEVIFTATIQALKVKKGRSVLEQLQKELTNRKIRKKFELVGCDQNRIKEYLNDLDQFGVLTKPVVFASLRYERWLDLNKKATIKARASILQELYQDYELDKMLEEYPETRVRFFMMTCFKNMNQELTNAFQKIIQELRKGNLSPYNIHERIQEIKTNLLLDNNEKFFLARMLFPHVDAADYVELVSTNHGDEDSLNLVYQTEGKDGQIYKIRPPFFPKEIARFHSLLSDSLLTGTFTRYHEFLLIFNTRNRLAGGLYWKNVDSDRVHLEWVAVAENYRGVSLSKRLLDDYYERMRQQGIRIITVGFYLENFFFKQGFEIDKRYGGLVKTL